MINIIANISELETPRNLSKDKIEEIMGKIFADQLLKHPEAGDDEMFGTCWSCIHAEVIPSAYVEPCSKCKHCSRYEYDPTAKVRKHNCGYCKNNGCILINSPCTDCIDLNNFELDDKYKEE